MAMRKILVDETNRELCEHGTVGFPMTVNHDDLWAFEGKSVPIHWHNDLEISLPWIARFLTLQVSRQCIRISVL